MHHFKENGITLGGFAPAYVRPRQWQDKRELGLLGSVIFNCNEQSPGSVYLDNIKIDRMA